MRYTITDPRRTNTEIILDPQSGPGEVEPTILHHVAAFKPVCFYVRYYHQPFQAAPLCHHEELIQRGNQQRLPPLSIFERDSDSAKLLKGLSPFAVYLVLFAFAGK